MSPTVDQKPEASGAPGGDETNGPSVLDQDWDYNGPADTPDAPAAAEDEDEEPAEAPEAEAKGEDDDPEPLEAEPETPAERKLRLRDGTEVSESDLKKAYGEQKDFQREREAFQAQQAQFSQHVAHIRQQEQFFAQQMPQVLATLQQQIPPMPDSSLLAEDPIAYANMRFAHEDGIRNLQRAQQAAQAHQQQTAAAKAQAFKQYEQAEMQRLVEVMPELKNEKTAAQLDSDMRKAARAYGFQDSDYAGLRDHRTLRVLADAAKWRALQEQKPKAIEKAKEAPPVVQAPARRRTSADTQAEQTREQLARLRRTGSARDAEALLSRYE